MLRNYLSRLEQFPTSFTRFPNPNVIFTAALNLVQFVVGAGNHGFAAA